MKKRMLLAVLLGVSAIGAQKCASGDASSAAGTSCAQVRPCGGTLVGSWNFVAGCETSGSAESALASQLCSDAVVQGAARTASGFVTFNSDLSYSRNSASTETLTLFLPPSCVSSLFLSTCDDVASSLEQTQFPIESVLCADANGGCSCSLVFAPTNVSESGTYTTFGSVLNFSQSGSTSYCVSDGMLHLIDLDVSPTEASTGSGNITADLVATQ